MIKIDRSILKTPFYLLAIILSMLYLTSCKNELKEKPNILFIITDDQSWVHAGCYGDKAVRTPAIDKLAMEGVTFNNAYCAAPSCSPSRAGILSGQDIYRLEGASQNYFFQINQVQLMRSGSLLCLPLKSILHAVRINWVFRVVHCIQKIGHISVILNLRDGPMVILMYL